MTTPLAPHLYGRQVEAMHLCPESHNHDAGRICPCCLVMATHRPEATMITTDRLDRWQAMKLDEMRKDGARL